MYVMINESHTNNKRYLIHYKPSIQQGDKGFFELENEKHEKRVVGEKELYDMIDSLWGKA